MKIIEGHGMTMGVAWSEAKRGFYSVQQNSEVFFTVWDGDFNGDLNRAEQDSPLALAAATGAGLFLLRDGLGIAPLYYGEINGTPAFASEVKALVGVADNIKEFPPGNKYLPGRGFIEYYSLNPVAAESISPEEASRKLREVLEQAVGRLSGNDEVGSWLSGGLDSSSLAALAEKNTDKLHTFAAGLKGAPDLKFANEMADYIGAEHHEGSYGFEDLLRVLPEVIYHLESFDALLVRSSLTNYLAAKMASDYVPVVFSGEGGDELFAGYSYLKDLPAEKLPDELIDITKRLHNTALQRVDRSAAAHGTVAHVGFLAPEVVDVAIRIPVDYKLYRGNGEPVEKWILRKAMEDLLPEEITWRPKAKFWQGAGVKENISSYAEDKISDSDFERERTLPDGSVINTKEELLYYRIFKEHFGELEDLSFVGRTKGAPKA